MKIKGGEITAISHSPSGQMVAHVHPDVGPDFIMPFGLPVGINDIVKGVEAELYTVDFAKAHAASLHAQVAQSLGSLPKIPNNPSQLPWYRKLWVVLSWYFRRNK